MSKVVIIMFSLSKFKDQPPNGSIIPDDIICIIFSYFLSLKDIAALNLVSKTWYSINHVNALWKRRFEHHYPDLHAKYTIASYSILSDSIDWYEMYATTYLQTCVDLPRDVIRDYHMIRRCDSAELVTLLAQPDWKKRLFFYDMQGASIWDFLYRLGENTRRQAILDLIFNKLSAGLRREDNTWDFSRQLTYDVERQLHINIPNRFSIRRALPTHNELLSYAFICNQATVVSAWLQLQTIPLNVEIIESLCLFAIRMGHQETLKILFSQLEQQNQPASLFVNWDNDEWDNVKPCEFSESRQPFYDYVFTWLTSHRLLISAENNLPFIALEFNQIEFMRSIDAKSADFNPLFHARSKEMVQMLRKERQDLISLPIRYSYGYISDCFNHLEVLHAICHEASYDWIKLARLAIESGSLQGFDYLSTKIPALRFELLISVLLTPNRAILLRFVKLYPNALKSLSIIKGAIDIKFCLEPPKYDAELLKWRPSFNKLKSLSTHGVIDMDWYLNQYGAVLFWAEMYNRFPRVEVIRFLLENFNELTHGDMIIRVLQMSFGTLTLHFNKYPHDVISYASLIEVMGELLALGIDVEKSDGYDTCILGQLSRLEEVNKVIADNLRARIPHYPNTPSKDNGCSIA